MAVVKLYQFLGQKFEKLLASAFCLLGHLLLELRTMPLGSQAAYEEARMEWNCGPPALRSAPS